MNGSPQPDFSWCKRIFDDLDPRPATSENESSVDIDNEPEWVQNVQKELSQQAMPSFCIRKPEGYLPRELGLYLGQQCANMYAMGEMMSEPTSLKIKAAKAKIKIYQQNRSVPGVESLLKVVEFLGQSLIDLQSYFPVFEKALHNAFKAALDQPNREDAADFFNGFAKGISKPGISRAGLARPTTATLIYQKLFVHRREIERQKNYSELQKFLKPVVNVQIAACRYSRKT
jgi:hypothetical protein